MKAADFEIVVQKTQKQRPRFDHSSQYGSMKVEVDDLGNVDIRHRYDIPKSHALAFGKWLVEVYGEEELKPI